MAKAKISPLVLVPPILFAGLAVMFYVGMYRDNPDALPSAIAGQVAPPVSLTPLGDKPGFDEAVLRADGVKLVNYWASWCAPCRVEHPHLVTLSEEGVPVYGINYKDETPKALAFLEELGDPYRGVAADVAGRTALDWGLYGVPETFVIDGNGQVVLRFAGPITGSVLENTIRPALAEAAAQ